MAWSLPPSIRNLIVNLSDTNPDYVTRKLYKDADGPPDVMSLWQSEFPHPNIKSEDVPVSFLFNHQPGLVGDIKLMVKGVFNIDGTLYVFGLAYPDMVRDKESGEARWPPQTWVAVQYSLVVQDGVIAIPKVLYDAVWGEKSKRKVA